MGTTDPSVRFFVSVAAEELSLDNVGDIDLSFSQKYIFLAIVS
jgi:hypothetical protein